MLLLKRSIITRQKLNWIYKIGFSIGDQFIFSGTNFVLALLVSRWVTPSEYGIYGITSTVYLFFLGLHIAIVVEPMTVIAPGRYRNRIADYLRVSFAIHLVLVLCMSIILLLIVYFTATFQTEALTASLIALAISLPFQLSYNLLRSGCYLENNSKLAFFASFLNGVITIGGALALKEYEIISASNAFYLLAIACGIPCVGLFFLLKIKPGKRDRAEITLSPASTVREHWHYGRWILVASCAFFFSSLIYVPATGAFLGLAQSGVLRAMQNLTTPLQQLVGSVAQLLVPWLSQKRATDGKDFPIKFAPKILLIFVGCGFVYCSILIIFGHDLVRIIYANEYYNTHVSLLYILSTATIAITGVQALATCLRAAEHPDAILWSKVGAALFSVSGGLVFIWLWGLTGAGLGILSSFLIETFILFIYIDKRYRSLFYKKQPITSIGLA